MIGGQQNREPSILAPDRSLAAAGFEAHDSSGTGCLRRRVGTATVNMKDKVGLEEQSSVVVSALN